jgi:2-haloacid dehalogenase
VRVVDRREFLGLATGSALIVASAIASVDSVPTHRYKAIAFDAFPIFDPRPVATLTESLFPGNGSAIMNAWRSKQFEYQWLRVLGGHYADFLQATEESLLFTLKQLKLERSLDQRQQLMSKWSDLQVWPDVPEAINALREAGLRLALLSNMTGAVLATGLKKAQLETSFEVVLSTDQIRSYKPDPRSYRLATDQLRLRREEILFVAFAGWDVAGAKWFGYPTFWVNRLSAPKEELGVEADASGQDLNSLVRFIRNPRALKSTT